MLRNCSLFLSYPSGYWGGKNLRTLAVCSLTTIWLWSCRYHPARHIRAPTNPHAPSLAELAVLHFTVFLMGPWSAPFSILHTRYSISSPTPQTIYPIPPYHLFSIGRKICLLNLSHAVTLSLSFPLLVRTPTEECCISFSISLVYSWLHSSSFPQHSSESALGSTINHLHVAGFRELLVVILFAWPLCPIAFDSVVHFLHKVLSWLLPYL